MTTVCRSRRGRLVGPRTTAMVVTVGLFVLAGCGSSLLRTSASSGTNATSTTAAGVTATTVPLNGEVAVAFPVVACTTQVFGGSSTKSANGWSPTILMAPVPTSLVGKVTFYTDGVHTLLGPTGWTCSNVTPGPSDQDQGQGSGTTTTTGSGVPGTTAVQNTPSSGQSASINGPGSTTLVVYPPNDPVPPTSGAPSPGAEGIFATYASTGTSAGVDLVCPYFAIPSWQSRSAGCSTSKATGELTNVLTPDVTAIADPAGVVGNLAASGGQTTVTGVVIFPQVPSSVSYGSPLAVTAESCALDDPGLCPTIVSDFEVREFPVPK